ncbi:MAG: cytochrome c biogenesis CcdA family protein [Bowdeniella nasicola]|nr:cytochrome c biogenesis CcdA family protein [Bowdeniella nasicola]
MTDIGLAGAALGGIASLLSPCAAMLLPSFFAYAFASRSNLLAKTGVFYLGLLTTLVPLGALAGSLGRLLLSYRHLVVVGSSVIVIVLGLAMMAGVSFRLPGAQLADQAATADAARPHRDPGGWLAVYVMGATYGVAGGCSGPILGSILALAGLGGSAAYGALLLAVYGLGMMVPLIILAALWDRLRIGQRGWLRARPLRLGPITTTMPSLIGGALFVAIGIFLLVTNGTQSLGGLLDSQQQIGIESSVRAAAGTIPDAVILLAIAVVAVSLALVWAWQREKRR